MTINSVYLNELKVGDGTTKAFTFIFKFLDEKDIVIFKIKSDGNEEVIPNSSYKLNTNSNNQGGTITFLVPPVLGQQMRICLVLDFKQSAEFKQMNPNPTTLEKCFDKATLELQILKDNMSLMKTFKTMPNSRIDFGVVLNENKLSKDEFSILILRYDDIKDKWYVDLSKNSIELATESKAGIILLATILEALNGTDDTKVMTPLKTKQVVDVEAASRVQGDAIVAQNANTRMDNLVS
ncbi:MAG: hypothetical protein LBH46_01760, partial [Rickettsiales bacterium]|nr:hypothetical protein [Rickettsiales bacterium]